MQRHVYVVRAFDSVESAPTSVHSQTGFFKQPCLHFPLADTYVQGGALLEEPGEKEDDPNGTPDAEPAELTAMGAQDAADAEAVLNQLMRTGANVAPPTGGARLLHG